MENLVNPDKKENVVKEETKEITSSANALAMAQKEKRVTKE